MTLILTLVILCWRSYVIADIFSVVLFLHSMHKHFVGRSSCLLVCLIYQTQYFRRRRYPKRQCYALQTCSMSKTTLLSQMELLFPSSTRMSIVLLMGAKLLSQRNGNLPQISLRKRKIRMLICEYI